MKISFLFHLYQPSFQDETIFKQVTRECYIPLLKFLQHKKNFKVTLNTPLSLLELMDKFGYQKWISDLKILVDDGQVELVGSAAYHPLLTRLPENLVEKQIVLNEYGLGYYFGRHRGFEGEPAMMIKNIKGFFPPELAIDESVVKVLDGLGYEWVLVNDTSVLHNEIYNHSVYVYSLLNFNINIVVRNSALSNAIAFKRDSKISDLPLHENLGIVALDGETFGHHNSQGIQLLENIHSCLDDRGISITTVGNNTYVKKKKDLLELQTFVESSWAHNTMSVNIHNLNANAYEEKVYPFWINHNNKLQTLQWKLLNEVLGNTISSEISLKSNLLSLGKIWEIKEPKDNIKDAIDVHSVKNFIRYILFMKLQNSDQFWWSSAETLPNNVFLYSKEQIRSSLHIYEHFLNSINDELQNKEIRGIIGSINRELTELS